MKPKIAYDDADIAALKALANGTASAGQQARALRFFFYLSGLREMPTYSENSLEMAFNDGRKFVGWWIAKIIELTGVTTEREHIV